MKDQVPGFREKRFKAAFAVIFLILVFLLFRVVYLQTVKGEEYTQAARAQQTSETNKTLSAVRGTIYDCNRTVLARTETTYDVIVDPMALQSVEEDLQQSTVKELAKILGVRKSETLSRYLTEEYRSSQYERFGEGMEINEATKVRIESKIENGQIAGVWMEAKQTRVYPNDELAAHVIGFNGVYGLEGEYNELLSGTDGYLRQTTSWDGRTETVLARAEDGCDLITSLNTTVQYQLEQGLARAMKEQECERACGILMNPKTGEVYAMAVYPTFDLNEVDNIIGLNDRYDEKRLQNADFLAEIWNNFAVSGTYQPGSTFKPIFSAAALDSGAINDSEEFECEGYFEFYDQTFKCAYNEVHGIQSIRDVIAHSCNIGMVQVSDKVSTEDYLQYQKAFGIGSVTGIDLPNETSASNLIYTDDDMGVIELATTAFGQGFNVTPIQLLRAESAVVNDGYLVTPHVVSRITDGNGNTVFKADNEPIRQVISASTSQIIREAMEKVVQSSSFSELTAGYRIGGKTGTAEKGDYDESRYVVSFTGFAPIDDPQVGILILMDETNSNSSSAPMKTALEVLGKILPYLNIFPE